MDKKEKWLIEHGYRKRVYTTYVYEKNVHDKYGVWLVIDLKQNKYRIENINYGGIEVFEEDDLYKFMAAMTAVKKDYFTMLRSCNEY